MEIKNSLLNNVDAYRTRLENQPDAASQRARQGAAVRPGAQGDRISLSPEALLRTEAHAAVSAAPDVRADKVNAIKERIASGEYSVDSQNIARKLLQSDALLAGTLKE